MKRVTTTAPDRERERGETRTLVDSIAREMWRRYGGGGTLNWPAVERHLGRIVAQARSDARCSGSGLILATRTTAPAQTSGGETPAYRAGGRGGRNRGPRRWAGTYEPETAASATRWRRFLRKGLGCPCP